MPVARNIAYIVSVIALSVFVFYWGIQFVASQVTIQVEMESASNDECQLFYDNGLGFSESRSLKKSILAEDGRQTLEFRIAKGWVKQVRFDPGFQTDSVVIHKVIIQVDTSKTILFGEEIQSWATTVNTDVSTLHSGAVRCTPNSRPEDMQVILKSSLFAENHAISTKETLWIAVFALFAGVGPFLFLFYYLQDIVSFFIAFYAAISNENAYTCISQGLMSWIRQNKFLMMLSIMVVSFSYGYELTSFSLSMDEELEALENALPPLIYVSLSRYGIFILKSLTDDIPVLPYIPFAISLLLLALSNVILTYLGRLTFGSSVVFTLLFLSSPVFSYYLLFNTINAQISFGIFLVTLAYALNHRVLVDWCDQNFEGQPGIQKALYILSILLMAFAFSIYQSTVIFCVVIFLFLLLAELINEPAPNDGKSVLIKCKYEIIRILIALILYKAGDIFFKYIYATEIGNYPPFIYLETFIHWPEKPVKEVLLSLLAFIPVLFDSKILFGGQSASYLYIPVIGLMVYAFKKRRKNFNWNIFFILIGLLISPFLLTILLGGPLPYRTYFSFPIMVAGLWGLFHAMLKGWLRGAVFLTSVAFFILQSYTVTNLFYKDHLCNEADKTFISNVGQRIRNLPWPITQQKYNVVIVGGLSTHHYDEIFIPSEMHGHSTFSSDNWLRYKQLFLWHGQSDYIINNQLNFNLLPCEHEGMPCWPAPGSVRLVGNTALVKLSEPSKK